MSMDRSKAALQKKSFKAARATSHPFALALLHGLTLSVKETQLASRHEDGVVQTSEIFHTCVELELFKELLMIPRRKFLPEPECSCDDASMYIVH
jgi:hypothetical protein